MSSMAIVHIPSLMRDLTKGQAQVTVHGRTLKHVVGALEEAFPGIKDRLFEADHLRAGIAVSIDGQISQLGLEQPVREEDEIRFLPSISGG
jgi:sulfur-carrier protein